MKFDAARLTALRLRAGLSIPALHMKMVRSGWNGTENALRNLEAGNVRFPHGSTLGALAQAFGVEECVFFITESTTAVEPSRRRAGLARGRRPGVKAAKGTGKP